MRHTAKQEGHTEAQAHTAHTAPEDSHAAAAAAVGSCIAADHEGREVQEAVRGHRRAWVVHLPGGNAIHSDQADYRIVQQWELWLLQVHIRRWQERRRLATRQDGIDRFG